jgi:septal ring factor EnvC (AmiA/AmiB activator)
LAQITSSAPIQADSGAVSKILALIDNLLERIAESREIERREYEAYVAEYDSARENQVQLLNETQAHLANLENEISALNKRLENASAERDEQRERSRQKNIEKVGRTKWCDDEAESYASRRNDRLDSIRVVSDCVGLIESKIRVLKEFVAQRLG